MPTLIEYDAGPCWVKLSIIKTAQAILVSVAVLLTNVGEL
mgnify:CR=1 FL=1